ncbi:uncharacterized protein LOC118452794 isoform X5 [Egretta garzetta]|uniref:uncharacterized protein LOC118452794 isoform X5 n=1 Tax=Egretta garzetta TaxID=188379 RepID=UPI00163C3D6F|nr:uncharacterized protein LOC118452794 isoform X5 [Egretta garzetta]
MKMCKTVPVFILLFTENHPLAAPTVAGISISFVFICMLITIGICCAQRKSKGFSAESNSAPSGEPEVSLKKISTHENQPWVTSPTRADADYLAVKTTCELGITCATYGLRHAPTTLSVWFMVLWFHCMLLSRETDRPCMPMGGRSPFYGDFYTTALLSGCVDTHGF